MSKERDRLIGKWENYFGEKSKSSIEINEDITIPYWNDDFVEGLLQYAEKLKDSNSVLKRQLNNILQEIKK